MTVRASIHPRVPPSPARGTKIFGPGPTASPSRFFTLYSFPLSSLSFQPLRRQQTLRGLEADAGN